MGTDVLKNIGGVNPELFQILGAYVSYHRKLRMIEALKSFAAAPSFKGPDGREIFLDQIGVSEDGAAASIRLNAAGQYQAAIRCARNFLKQVYDIDEDPLQAWLDEALPPEEPAKQVDEEQHDEAEEAAS